jgi:hypothetical protein
MRLPNRPRVWDVIVTLACVALLGMTLAAVGAGGRRRAREFVCQSHLHQWFGIFQGYLDQNGASSSVPAPSIPTIG